ncbi:MAG TPA: sulfite exporter TauE/SafE family protein [Chloroflexi bacterium]|nr:sulfite exporter TauE/SafE family protein [Chloroflexota bacterium]
MSVYWAPPIFFVIAFVFSMLGMGGSQLYVPVLYWLGMDFKTEAIPLGMLLNVVNSSTAAITYGRKHLIDWQIALPFGIAMILMAPLGTWLNVNLPTEPIIVMFALFTASAAVLMLSGWRPKGRPLSGRGRTVLGVSAGSGLGLLAGLIGRGGGSFVVPLLYIAGVEPKMAAATSALVVTGSGLSSFVSHVATAADPDWMVWILSVTAVWAGSRLGSRVMSTRLNPRMLKKVFGIVLLGVAGLLLVKTLS